VSRPAALRLFDRAALGLLIAFALGLLVVFVWSLVAAGEPGGVILANLFGILWLALPIAAAAALVGASPSSAGALLFLLLEILLVLSVAFFFLPGLGWGAGIALMFMPILHAGVIILVFMIALAFGWRMRPDFLRD
jgi:hypothetical protein